MSRIDKTFSRGDIVQLKSGGPPMTVFNCFADPIKPDQTIVQTVYFVALDRREFHIFAPETLCKIAPDVVEGFDHYEALLKKNGHTKP